MLARNIGKIKKIKTKGTNHINVFNPIRSGIDKIIPANALLEKVRIEANKMKNTLKIFKSFIIIFLLLIKKYKLKGKINTSQHPI